MSGIIQVQEVSKVYAQGHLQVEALRGVTFEARGGEFLAICGPSGSGKSTLMNILGCLDRPTTGAYLLEGRDVAGLTDDELARLRNARIGFVFQTFHLLPRLTALRNVEMPLVYSGLAREERRRRAHRALEAVGLGDRLLHRPSELSGGEQQRVAIARGLVSDPAILLADEPTGNLDSRAGEEIIGILGALNAQGATIVLVTHNARLAQRAGRIIALEDGKIASDLTTGARSS